MIRHRSGIRHAVWGALAALFLAYPARAQSNACPPAQELDRSPASWMPPLDRPVTATPATLTLRDALGRLATIAGVRLSYSTEAVPLDRLVCLRANGAPLGQVLGAMLTGTGVAAVGIGDDQVVLAPRLPPVGTRTAARSAPSMRILEKVVVTSSAIAMPARNATVSTAVVDGAQLARDHTSTLADVLDGYVPGVWSWTQSPTSVLGSYASLRGASSFGLSYPKIYIDGIEVANPLLITRFTADAIDHVEVIRGPQGSALYGTDAISGVVNIVTRHEGAGRDGNHGTVRTSAGLVQSDFAHGVVAQSHALSLVTGTDLRSLDLHIAANTVGDFIPNGYSRDLAATASARVVRSRATFGATGRFFTQEVGPAASPLLAAAMPDSVTERWTGDAGPQTVHEYTLGGTATILSGERWTHTFVAGVDGYTLDNVQPSLAPISTVTDSALRAAQGSANRATLRATSRLRLGGDDGTGATFAFSAEHGFLQGTSTAYGAPVAPARGRMQVSPVARGITTWQTSTGLTAEATGSLDDTWFASGGVRVERDSRLPGSKLVALPMLGAAAVRDFGPVTMKLRAAFGEGIRPAATPVPAVSVAFGRTVFAQRGFSMTQPALGAERQSGTELGVDLAIRDALSLRLTRFDQHASGLIQQVALPDPSGSSLGGVRYALENVGEIANHGWEMEARATLSRRLTVSGTMSLVDSRVVHLANEYEGDLVAGDRMLQVPARTAAINVAYSGRRWLGTISASRAMNWINYDELGLARAAANGSAPGRDLAGLALRDYWRRYDGGIRVRASLSREIRGRFAVDITGDNLLNYQENGPDNITIVPGRTLMTGVRIRF